MPIGSLTGGELYFIGEIDPHTSATTQYTKIGIVRDQRPSDKRLLEHHTGNPRQLIVIEQMRAPIIERIETAMHQAFATARLSGEWFYFASGGQSRAIERAKVLAGEAREAESLINAAAKLQKKASNGTVVAPTESLLENHALWLYLRELKSIAETIEKTVKASLTAATHAGFSTSSFFALQEKRDAESFDEVGLRDAHPRVWAKYVSQSVEISQRFTPSKLSSDSSSFVDERLDELRKLAASVVEESESATTDADALARLHDGYLRTLTIRGPVEWEIDLLEARLKAACGEAAEIRGVCKWSRTTTTKEKFDKSRFRKEHPDLFNKFVTVKMSRPSSVIRRDRGFRL